MSSPVLLMVCPSADSQRCLPEKMVEMWVKGQPEQPIAEVALSVVVQCVPVSHSLCLPQLKQITDKTEPKMKTKCGRCYAENLVHQNLGVEM